MNSLYRTRRIHFIQFTHLPFDVGKIVINKIETAKSNIVNRLLETENRLIPLMFSLSDCETSGFSL